MGAKIFRPEFKTRDGKKVSFGANYTHNTKAKRRAGLTKAGRPRPVAGAPGATARPFRFWSSPWLTAGCTVACGGAYAYARLGPVLGSMALAAGLYVGYRVARWVVGEVAHWRVKARQIRGGQVAQFASEAPPPAVHIPAETVNYGDHGR
ncbi:hypothetical protein ACFQL8_17155 [Streptomyces goshikiensis]|uniref:hypothetical protein n=1 Tax=Streptomyces goshikiensis TaxID=1942 RepID=UPI001677A171|nr:hypothetical protein [Streptomyces goshikiensis]GHD56007.1 hypothetical protein GCM10010336_00840 [Streptomyces goshikiensis]